MAGEAAERAVLDGLSRGTPAAVELVAEYGYHSAGRAEIRLIRSIWVKLRAARAEEGARRAAKWMPDQPDLQLQLESGARGIGASTGGGLAIAALEWKLPSLSSRPIRFKARRGSYPRGARNWRVAADVLEAVAGFKQPGSARSDERESPLKRRRRRKRPAERPRPGCARRRWPRRWPQLVADHRSTIMLRQNAAPALSTSPICWCLARDLVA